MTNPNEVSITEIARQYVGYSSEYIEADRLIDDGVAAEEDYDRRFTAGRNAATILDSVDYDELMQAVDAITEQPNGL